MAKSPVYELDYHITFDDLDTLSKFLAQHKQVKFSYFTLANSDSQRLLRELWRVKLGDCIPEKVCMEIVSYLGWPWFDIEMYESDDSGYRGVYFVSTNPLELKSD